MVWTVRSLNHWFIFIKMVDRLYFAVFVEANLLMFGLKADRMYGMLIFNVC